MNVPISTNTILCVYKLNSIVIASYTSGEKMNINRPVFYRFLLLASESPTTEISSSLVHLLNYIDLHGELPQALQSLSYSSG